MQHYHMPRLLSDASRDRHNVWACWPPQEMPSEGDAWSWVSGADGGVRPGVENP